MEPSACHDAEGCCDVCIGYNVLRWLLRHLAGALFLSPVGGAIQKPHFAESRA